jgi:tetratricopeptide (TPR) repeat protein
VDAVSRAKSLCARGRELHNARRLEEAVEVYKEALAIYRQLAEQHPHEYLPEVAWTLRALADTLYSLRRLDEAINAYREALTIHQQLTPEVFDSRSSTEKWDVFSPNFPTVAWRLRSVGGTLNNLGNALLKQGDLKAAVEAYQQSAEIYRRLVGLLPGGVFEFFLALVVFNLGVAYSELSLWDSAAKAYQEALHNFQRSVSEYPEASDFGIAQSLCRLGKTLHRLQQSEEALKALEKASAILRRLARRRSPEYEPELAETLVDLGQVLLEMRRLKASVQAYEEAYRIYRRLGSQQSQEYQPRLESTRTHLKRALSAWLGSETAAQKRLAMLDKS